MIDIFSTIGGLLAIIGVVGNNHRLRWCFLAFIVSNPIAMVIHTVRGPLPYAVRDLVFLCLAVHGWIRWGSNKNYRLTGYEILKRR